MNTIFNKFDLCTGTANRFCVRKFAELWAGAGIRLISDLVSGKNLFLGLDFEMINIKIIVFWLSFNVLANHNV